MKTAIFDQTFPSGWRKVITQRSQKAEKTANRFDSYVYSPSGKQIRSNVELLKYIMDNPDIVSDFNPKEINMEKHSDSKIYGSATTKLIKFIDLVKSGVSLGQARIQVYDSDSPGRPDPLELPETPKPQNPFKLNILILI